MAGDKIIRALEHIFCKYPFYDKILSYCMLERDSSVKTAGVTIRNARPIIKYNVEFMEQLDVDEIVFVLLHEVLHFILDHLSRSLAYDHFWYNIAADMVINDYLVNALGLRNKHGFVMLPEDYHGDKLTEEVYKYIRSQQKAVQIAIGIGQLSDIIPGPSRSQQRQQEGEGEGAGNVVTYRVCDVPIDKVNDSEAELCRDFVATIVQEAAKSIGYTPLAELFDMRYFRLTEKKREIKRAIHVLFSAILGRGYIYKASNKKIKDDMFRRVDPKIQEFDPDIVLPGRASRKGFYPIHIIIDTSGSMFTQTNKNVNLIEYSISVVSRFFQHVFLYYSDTQVYPMGLVDLQKFVKQQTFSVQGGGGTSFQDAFNTILGNKQTSKKEQEPIIILVTDGIVDRVHLNDQKAYILVLYYDQPVEFENKGKSKIIQIQVKL